MALTRRSTDQEFIDAASDQYYTDTDGSRQIDISAEPQPTVSRGEYGAWVQAWVFVNYDEGQQCPDCHNFDEACTCE